MKYQHITEDEIKTIREAKKVMKKIAKRFSRLEAKEKKALLDENADWKPIAEQFYRFCDEIVSIFDNDGYKISINVDFDKPQK
jgi:DNA-directed RNA polymerase subunit F